MWKILISKSTVLPGSDEPISYFDPGGHLRRAYQFNGNLLSRAYGGWAFTGFVSQTLMVRNGTGEGRAEWRSEAETEPRPEPVPGSL